MILLLQAPSTRSLVRINGMKGILTSVASQAKFRQTQHSHAAFPRGLNRLTDVQRVMRPVKWRLVQHRRGYMDEFHDIRSPRAL